MKNKHKRGTKRVPDLLIAPQPTARTTWVDHKSIILLSSEQEKESTLQWLHPAVEPGLEGLVASAYTKELSCSGTFHRISWSGAKEI